MNKKFDSKQSKWKKALSLFDKVVKKHTVGSGAVPGISDEINNYWGNFLWIYQTADPIKEEKTISSQNVRTAPRSTTVPFCKIFFFKSLI